MSSPVAVVTGGSSGIGLAVSKHLIAKGWKVVLADLNPPPASESQYLPESQAKYIDCDVTSYDQQAHAFATAFEWGGRLDFAALNAGTDDRDDIFSSIDPATPPKKPDMFIFDVNLFGPYYGIKLAAHYFSRTSPEKPKKGGKIVITSSAAGFWPHPAIPQYVATKFGLVGLTRSLAPVAAPHNITVNCICPAMVQTGLAPAGLMEGTPKDQTTPMSTMLRAFDELMDEEANWNGQCVVGNVDRLFYMESPPPVENMRHDQAMAKLWADVYLKRNVEFTRRNEEKQRGKL